MSQPSSNKWRKFLHTFVILLFECTYATPDRYKITYIHNMYFVMHPITHPTTHRHRRSYMYNIVWIRFFAYNLTTGTKNVQTFCIWYRMTNIMTAWEAYINCSNSCAHIGCWTFELEQCAWMSHCHAMCSAHTDAYDNAFCSYRSRMHALHKETMGTSHWCVLSPLMVIEIITCLP